MKRVCVFCGSSPLTGSKYSQTAKELAENLVERNIGLVYGGASIGTMGIIADAVLHAGGEVIGVMPQLMMDREIAHQGLTEMRLVKSMHERKALMAELSDGFIALPGGLGTLEELFEALTMSLLEIHRKPCGILNVHGYYQKLIAFLEYAETEQFIKKENRSILIVEEDPGTLIQKFLEYEVPEIKRWTELTAH